MINNYGIFNYHKENKSLVILFDEGRNAKEAINDEITLLKKDDKVVGYEIVNFIKYAKIRYSGIVFLPAKELIDVINSVLSKYKLETLAYKNSSGYIVKKEDEYAIVYAEEGVFLIDETISKGHVCTFGDLDYDIPHPERICYIGDLSRVGKDFFILEDEVC